MFHGPNIRIFGGYFPYNMYTMLYYAVFENNYDVDKDGDDEWVAGDDLVDNGDIVMDDTNVQLAPR